MFLLIDNPYSRIYQRLVLCIGGSAERKRVAKIAENGKNNFSHLGMMLGGFSTAALFTARRYPILGVATATIAGPSMLGCREGYVFCKNAEELFLADFATRYQAAYSPESLAQTLSNNMWLAEPLRETLIAQLLYTMHFKNVLTAKRKPGGLNIKNGSMLLHGPFLMFKDPELSCCCKHIFEVCCV